MSVLTATRARRRRTYLPAADRRTQILERAKTGIARRTLYQYFDTKRAVLLALLGDVAARVRHVLQHRAAVADLDIDLARLRAADVAEFCERRMRQVIDTIFLDEKTLRLVLREA